MDKAKKQVIFAIGMSWIIMIGLIVTMVIESRLEDPWVSITNALWVAGMVALGVFMGRGVYFITKYLKMRKDEKDGT